MARGKLNPKDKEAWQREIVFYKSSDTQARALRAGELGFEDSESYGNFMRRHGVYLSVPASGRERFDKAETIREPCLVLFDAQIPFHDATFLNQVLEVAADWHIRQGISGGDLLNMTSFSRFFEKPSDKIWRKERDDGVKVLLAMADAIPNWLMLMGNHEDFLLKKLEEQMGHEDILSLMDQRGGSLGAFSATDYYRCDVRLGGAKWRITHPRNISVIHGRIPQRLADKFQANIASGHGHLAGMTPSYGAKFMCCDVGVCCDPSRLDYVGLRDSTRPAMCQGALILQLGEDGKCHPYHILPDADWAALKRLY